MPFRRRRADISRYLKIAPRTRLARKGLHTPSREKRRCCHADISRYMQVNDMASITLHAISPPRLPHLHAPMSHIRRMIADSLHSTAWDAARVLPLPLAADSLATSLNFSWQRRLMPALTREIRRHQDDDFDARPMPSTSRDGRAGHYLTSLRFITPIYAASATMDEFLTIIACRRYT